MVVENVLYDIVDVDTKNPYLDVVITNSGLKFMVSPLENSDDRYNAVSFYWYEMIENNPEKFVEIVGIDRLLSWAMRENIIDDDFCTSGDNIDDWIYNMEPSFLFDVEKKERKCIMNNWLKEELSFDLKCNFFIAYLIENDRNWL